MASNIKMGRLLKHIVNSDWRQYIIDKVNEPLLAKIVTLAFRYPAPTREGVGKVVHPNSLILLDIQDEFFRHWVTSRSNSLFRALWRVLIVKYEHCPNLRNMLDWFFMMTQKSNWKPFNPNRQMTTWKGGQ